MNSDNFSDFIEQPAHLYQIPYEELKSLVLQYPYCQNLHYLLLKKSKMENHRDFDKNLHLAATFSPDRTFLMHQIRKTALGKEVKEHYELAEDYLELKDLSEIQHILEEVYLEKKEEPASSGVLFNPGPPIPDEDIPAPAFSFSDREPLQEFEEDPEEDHAASPGEVSGDEAPPIQTTDTPAQIHLSLNDLILDMAPVIDLTQEMDFSDSKVEEMEVISVPEALINMLATGLQVLDTLEFQVSEPAPDIANFVVSDQQINLLVTGLTVLNTLKFQVAPAPPVPVQEKQQSVAPAVIPLEITNEYPEVQTVAPTPKTSFSSWLKQFQAPHVSVQLNQILETSPPPRKKKKKPKKKLAAEVLAQRSVQAPDVISETLAGILAQQGHHRKALQMYTQLQSESPERAAYFEELIQSLQKKIR
ncbi:MAG: hypothetical protein KDC34_02920 [Saprospiraceae bacterium]|nr:hypothetical protein [Saprospiraceae bacterium]